MQQQKDQEQELPTLQTQQDELVDEVCNTEGNFLNQTNSILQKNNVKIDDNQYVVPFEINNKDNKTNPNKVTFQSQKNGGSQKQINLKNQFQFNGFPFSGIESTKFQDDFNLKTENSDNLKIFRTTKNSNMLQSSKELEFANNDSTPTQNILQFNLQSNQISTYGEDAQQKKNEDVFDTDEKQQVLKSQNRFQRLFQNLNKNQVINKDDKNSNKIYPLNSQDGQNNINPEQDNQKQQNTTDKKNIGGLFKKKKNKILWMFRMAKKFDKSGSSISQKKNYIELFRRKVRTVIYLLRFYEIIKDINKEIFQRKTQSDIKRKMTSHIYRRYSWFPIFPNDPIKNFWNVCLFISLILMAFITPFTVCIVDNYDEQSVWFGLDTLFDIIFGFDIMMNFVSAYQDDKSKVVQNYKDIIKNYMTGWFFIDIVALIPFNRLSNGSTTYNKLVRLLRLPRLYNLAKLIKLNRAGSDSLITKIQDRLKMNIASRQLLNLFFLTIIASHLIACLWFLTSRMDDFSPRTWVYRKGIIHSNYGEKYITSIYWAFQTLFVIGYGDLGAFTMAEQIVSIIWMIFSVGFYSFVISNLSSLIIQANKKQTMLKDTLDSIDQIQAKCKLPPTLVKKIKKFYETNYDFNIYFPFLENNQSVILNDMWDNIKQEVILLSQIDYLNKVDIFKVNFIFTSHILPYLKMLKCKENEMVYRKDDSSEEIFFLITGEVCLIDSNNNVILKIKGGSMFGEVEVIEMSNRKDFCRCITDCMILLIDKEKFLNEMEKFDNLKDEIFEICKMKRKLMDEARNKIVMKRLQTKMGKESASKDQERRDSIFEEQSGIEFSIQQKKLPNSSRHYYLFLKAYNKYREKMTKKKLNVVYSEMFEQDVEDKSEESEGDEIFEADQEEYEDEQEEVDSNAYRKINTIKQQKTSKMNRSGGKSYENIYENNNKSQFKQTSCRTIQIPNQNGNNTYNNKKGDGTPQSLLSNTLFNLKNNNNNNNNNSKHASAIDSNKHQSIFQLKGQVDNDSCDDSDNSENVDDFNQAYDHYQGKESSNNILQSKLKKIKNNVSQIQRLKQQYDLLLREVNIKKNTLRKFSERQEQIKISSESK